MNIDMGYEISISDPVHQYGYLPYRYGHPGYRYGIWANDVGDDSIDTVILDVGMGYGRMMWQMTVSIWSSWISIWDMG
jgi:hypothetical protein